MLFLISAKFPFHTCNKMKVCEPITVTYNDTGVKSASSFLSIYKVCFKQTYIFSCSLTSNTPPSTACMTLTAYWWMCHFSPFVWWAHQHFTTSVLFSQKSPPLETPSPLWALSVIPRPLQFHPSVWTGVQFQTTITLDVKTRSSTGSEGSRKIVHHSH